MTRMSAAITRFEILRPIVSFPAVLGHVRPHAGRDLVVDGAELVDRHAVLLHNRFGDFDQSLRM